MQWVWLWRSLPVVVVTVASATVATNGESDEEMSVEAGTRLMEAEQKAARRI